MCDEAGFLDERSPVDQIPRALLQLQWSLRPKRKQASAPSVVVGRYLLTIVILLLNIGIDELRGVMAFDPAQATLYMATDGALQGAARATVCRKLPEYGFSFRSSRSLRVVSGCRVSASDVGYAP
jgi:hypothetical protein